MSKKKKREPPPCELDEPFWSVVSFDGCVASNLTYDDARKMIAKLAEEDVSGLCIVTNRAAKHIKRPASSGISEQMTE